MYFTQYLKCSRTTTLLTLLLSFLFSSISFVYAGTFEFDSTDNTLRAEFGDGTNSYGELTRYSGSSSYQYSGSNDQDALRLNYSQLLGEQTLHFSGFQGPEEQNLNFGVTLGKTTLSFSSGAGSRNAWEQNDVFGFSNNYINGFTPASYSFSGAGINYQFNPKFNAAFGGMQVHLKDRVDTQTYYASVTWSRLSGTWLATERNDFTLASSLDLSYNFKNFTASYHEFKNYNDYTLRKMQVHFKTTKRGRLALSFESGVSPFTGNDETRVMWVYHGNIKGNRGHSRNAASKNKGGAAETPDGHSGYGKYVALGVGAVGIAAVVGSSSGNGDGGDGGFEAQHNAGRNVLNSINPTSVRQNREFGGWVYRSPDGSFAATTPVRGQQASVDIGDPRTSVPAGTVATASYHTHGGPDPRFDNENFSPQDIAVDNAQGVDGYLGTPAGSLQFHDRRAGTITRIGTIAN